MDHIRDLFAGEPEPTNNIIRLRNHRVSVYNAAHLYIYTIEGHKGTANSVGTVGQMTKIHTEDELVALAQHQRNKFYLFAATVLLCIGVICAGKALIGVIGLLAVGIMGPSFLAEVGISVSKVGDMICVRGPAGTYTKIRRAADEVLTYRF